MTKYLRADLEIIFDVVKEIERHSGMIADRIRTDYFSDDDYHFETDLKIIEMEFEKIKKYLPADKSKNISVDEANENFIEFMSYIFSKN